MATIACDICGGNLSMDPSGDFAVCESCGMKHTKDRLKTKAQEITGTVAVSNLAGIESLMKRGWLALEDSDWNGADEFFDKVLDIDAEYAPAYIGKLCADVSNGKESWLKNDLFTYVVKKEMDLAHYYLPLGDLPDYKKAIRFADEAYRAQLEGYNNEIKKHIEDLKKEFVFYMVIGYVFYSDYRNRTDILSNSNFRTPTIGKLSDGSVLKIQRTGSQYQYRDGNILYTYNDIKKGDIAVITHEMLGQQKREEQQRLEKEKRDREEQQRRQAEEQQKKEEQQWKIDQSNQWKKLGLCEYCGGKISLFGRTCKDCGKVN